MIGSIVFERAGEQRTFWPWLLKQPAGWLVTIASIVARLRHDVIPRTLNLKISQTNEMVVPRAYKQRSDGKLIVDEQSKITVQLVKFPAWMASIAALLGPVVWGLYQIKKFGWMDFPEPNEKKSMNVLNCGGNLVHVLSMFGIWVLVETQDITKSPNLELRYETDPQLCIKQVVVGNNAQKEIYWITDQNRGDIIVPFVTDVQAAFRINECEFPSHEFPFETIIWGRKGVTIYRAVFQGSDTWADIGGGRWVRIEWMEVTGLGSWRDRRLHIRAEDWFDTCPPPVKGWTKGKAQ